MVDADQRIVQDAPQRLDGTEVRVLAPGQIGEMTGGEPQPPLLLVVVVEQRIAPGHQALAQAADARLAPGDLGRRPEPRPDERRAGKECVGTCRSRLSPNRSLTSSSDVVTTTYGRLSVS